MVESTNNIKIIIDGELAECAQYGIHQLRQSLSGMSKPDETITLYVGVFEKSEKTRLLAAENNILIDHCHEAYSFKNCGEGVYSLIGYDEEGLMHGCLELSERLEYAELSEIEDFHMKPFIKTRGLYTFLHNRDLEEEWFYSEKFWNQYFDMMASNRYNSFNLVFSHQTYYLAPMFAYFTKVEEHPEVYAIDADDKQIERNSKMLRFITEQAEKRGITFILGIWQVRAWPPHKDWKGQPGTVVGLNDNNIIDYTYKGIKKILKEFRGIKGIQLRMNIESGIAPEKQTEFFKNTFFKAIQESERPIILDFRGWLVKKETLEAAVSMCPNIRLSVKYWAEFLGAPYQPAKISPGYSYSDFLQQPLRYDFLWQVWSLGNPRLLLWGDPEYVKRFVNSLTLGGGTGFEINPPLSQKGYGNEPGYWRIFKNKEDEYYEFEYERYWMFFMLFGRISFNPDVPSKIWERELARRLGVQNSLNMLIAYESSSRIMCFIIQYMLSDYNMYIWPEIDTGGLLDYYLEAPTSDSCTINTIANYVSDYLCGRHSGKLSPDKATEYLKELAAKTLENIDPVIKSMDYKNNKELKSTVIDFQVLSYLALFHAEKIQAAKHLAFYYETRNYGSLKKCYDHIIKSTLYWEHIIQVTQDVYYDSIVTGPIDSGHWKKKLLLVYEDELRIMDLIRIFEKYGNFEKGYDFGTDAIRMKGEYLSFPIFDKYTTERGFTGVDHQCIYSKDKGYGFTGLNNLKAVTAPNVRLADIHTDNKRRDSDFNVGYEKFKGYRNMLFEDYVYGNESAEFIIDVEDGDYEVTLLFGDQSKEARFHGPMTACVGDETFSDLVVAPFEIRKEKVRTTAKDNKIIVKFKCAEGSDWFISGIIVKSLKPEIKLIPYRIADKFAENLITATVTCPDDLKLVEIYLDFENGSKEVYCMKKLDTYTYGFNINNILEKKGWSDFSYRVRALAENRLEKTTEYIKVKIKDRDSRFDINHDPVSECNSGEDIKIRLSVKSSNKLKVVKLHYSHVNQFKELESVDMAQGINAYEACIPASYVQREWNILYYFEIVDEFGEGLIYPDFRERTPYYVIEVMK